MQNLAQKALDHLFLHESVDGIRFGPIPQILFTSDPSKTPRIQGQVYINLGTRWAVFASRPEAFPLVENDLPEISKEQQLKMICDLRHARVDNIELGHDAPHLIFTLQDGRILFINGHDDNYEPWQAGESFVPIGLSVIACPGGAIALFGAEELIEK